MCKLCNDPNHHHDHEPGCGPTALRRRHVLDAGAGLTALYAGICHSDIHHAREDWRKETCPMVPGHDIAGKVTQVGKNVTRFKVGHYAGIGCLANSCGACDYCKRDEEQYCERRARLSA